MKKITIKNIIATLILAIILTLIFPWWCIMIAAFVTAIVFPLSRRAVFFAPFIAIFVYWIVYAFILTSANDFTLSRKIAQLFNLGSNWIVVLFFTGIVGGFAAGIAGVFGRQLRLVVDKNM